MIISQRLVKRICPFCKKEHELEEKLKEKVHEELKEIMDEHDIDELKFYK
jgi:type II secretory ATPase GspE/PulE/Tfp pilus assembly ATPase PilB-like protein